MTRRSVRTNEIDADIRTKVAIWKAKTGGTQCEIAKKLHISPQFLYQILNGRRPGVSYVDRINELIQEIA